MSLAAKCSRHWSSSGKQETLDSSQNALNVSHRPRKYPCSRFFAKSQKKREKPNAFFKLWIKITYSEILKKLAAGSFSRSMAHVHTDVTLTVRKFPLKRLTSH